MARDLRIPRLAAGLTLGAGALAAAAALAWLPGRSGPALPAPAAADPAAAALRDEARLQSRLELARSRLPAAGSFDRWLADWSGRWALRSRSAELTPDLEIRRCVLDYGRPALADWPDIVATLGILERKPGVTIDRLVLAGPPDGAGAFVQVQLVLTARLRP